MTDKEQIEEMARNCCSRSRIYKTCKECIKESEKVFGRNITFAECDCYSYARKFFNKGYHKIIWHKVANNDLPKEDGWYYCLYLKDNDVKYYDKMLFMYGKFLQGFLYKIIAWTELPKYKEENMEEDKITISKKLYKELDSTYAMVYEQAKADILANMADGETSCHWCIKEHKKEGSKETAKEIFYKAERKSFFQDGGYYGKDRRLIDIEELKQIIQKEYDVEIEE